MTRLNACLLQSKVFLLMELIELDKRTIFQKADFQEIFQQRWAFVRRN